MFHRLTLVFAAAMLALPAAPSLAAKAPENWDGLVKVKAKKLDLLYLLPDADFRPYSKVMIDRPEIAFHKDWKRDYNMSQRSLGGRVDDEDMRKAIDAGRADFIEALVSAYGKAGYQIVNEPGADVLRVSTGVVNIEVNAPDLMTAGRTRTYTQEAGEATLVLEARDSVSGTLMGRAVDRSLAGDMSYVTWRNRVTNRSDFSMLFSYWAKTSAEGLGKLKAVSPVNVAGITK
jgi:hypothetical protein